MLPPPLPRPRLAPGERAILHAEGDPWNGCVVKVVTIHTAQLVKARLPIRQRPFARALKEHHRLLSTSDLF